MFGVDSFTSCEWQYLTDPYCWLAFLIKANFIFLKEPKGMFQNIMELSMTHPNKKPSQNKFWSEEEIKH